jgi:methyl-accepting chemotaxis protein
MTDIVGSVKRVNDTLGEITAAASSQSAGISEINSSITALDQMTQQNSALVEESAAAAESLKEQAARLTQVVSTFKLDRRDASPVHRQSPEQGASRVRRLPG